MWLSGYSTGLHTKGSWVRFPGQGHVPRLQVRSPDPTGVRVGGNQSMYLSDINVSVSLSPPSFPPSLLLSLKKYPPVRIKKIFFNIIQSFNNWTWKISTFQNLTVCVCLVCFPSSPISISFTIKLHSHSLSSLSWNMTSVLGRDFVHSVH